MAERVEQQFVGRRAKRRGRDDPIRPSCIIRCDDLGSPLPVVIALRVQVRTIRVGNMNFCYRRASEKKIMYDHQEQPTFVPHPILNKISSVNNVFHSNTREITRNAASIQIPRLNNVGARDEARNTLLSGPPRLSRSYGDSDFNVLRRRGSTNSTGIYTNNEQCVSAHILRFFFNGNVKLI